MMGVKPYHDHTNYIIIIISDRRRRGEHTYINVMIFSRSAELEPVSLSAILTPVTSLPLVSFKEIYLLNLPTLYYPKSVKMDKKILLISVTSKYPDEED